MTLPVTHEMTVTGVVISSIFIRVLIFTKIRLLVSCPQGAILLTSHALARAAAHPSPPP